MISIPDDLKEVEVGSQEGYSFGDAAVLGIRENLESVSRKLARRSLRP